MNCYFSRCEKPLPILKLQMLSSPKDHFWPDTKILIVEDDEFNFQFMLAIFHGKGPEIIRARTGEDALRIFSDDKQISLILMDIQIPVIDGFEVTRRIREEDSDIPIIAQTAFIQDHEEEKCLEVGCSAYISKPVDLGKLLDLVGVHLG